MSEVKRIDVQYSEDSLFNGWDEADMAEVDVAESCRRFGASLEAHLVDAYPDAEIVVTFGDLDRSEAQDAEGFHLDDETPWVDQIIERVYNGDDWYTPAEAD